MNETVSSVMTGAVMAPVCHGEGLTDAVGWVRVAPMIIICLIECRERERIPSSLLCPTAAHSTHFS